MPSNESLNSFHFELKPSTIPSASEHNISFELGDGVSVISDFWSINVQSQYGADFNITLGSQWGFDHVHASTITLHLAGNTSNETYFDDGEMIFILSVGDEYFAEQISLDDRRTAYKECPRSNGPLITRNVQEMVNADAPSRHYRFCENEVGIKDDDGTDFWVNNHPKHSVPAEWPLTLSITNDPISDTVTYEWSDASSAHSRICSVQFLVFVMINDKLVSQSTAKNLANLKLKCCRKVTFIVSNAII